MRKIIESWMLAIAIAGLLALPIACSKDSSSEGEYAEPGASEGDEIPPESPPATEPTQPLEPIPSTNPGADPLQPPPSEGESTPTTSEPAPAQTLQDGQIIKVTQGVDAAEIAQGKLAKTKSKNARVKKFATHMISEHTASRQKGMRLSKSADLSAEDSPLSGQLQTKTDRTLEALEQTEPSAFDSAYMNAQVQQHREVLNLIDSELLPNADNPDLKAQLQAAREMVERHLNEAEEVQRSLSE
jgi:putative membrane protein